MPVRGVHVTHVATAVPPLTSQEALNSSHIPDDSLAVPVVSFPNPLTILRNAGVTNEGGSAGTANIQDLKQRVHALFLAKKEVATGVTELSEDRFTQVYRDIHDIYFDVAEDIKAQIRHRVSAAISDGRSIWITPESLEFKLQNWTIRRVAEDLLISLYLPSELTDLCRSYEFMVITQYSNDLDFVFTKWSSSGSLRGAQLELARIKRAKCRDTVLKTGIGAIVAAAFIALTVTLSTHKFS